MAWDDKPPTAEELKDTSWAASAPTAQELASTAPPAPPSNMEALGRGAVSGATLGWSPKLLGAGAALGNVVAGPDKLADIGKNYEKYKDYIKAGDEAARKAHPLSYMGGELAGGVAGGLAGGALLGGAGAAAEAAGGAAEAANGFGANVLNAGKIGAAVGGLGAAGQTDLGNPGQAAHDIGKGALVGGLTGGALSTVGQTVGGALSKIKGGQYGQYLQDAWKAGRQGQGLLNNADTKDVEAKAMNYAGGVSGDMMSTLKQASQDIGAGIDQATAAGKKVDISDGFQKIADEMRNPQIAVSSNTPETMKAADLIDQMATMSEQQGGFTPQKAQFYKKMLDQQLAYQNGTPAINSETEYYLNQARGLLAEQLKASLPEDSANAYRVFGGISNLQDASTNGDIQQQILQTMKDMNSTDALKQKSVNDFFATVGNQVSPEYAAELRNNMQQYATRSATAKASGAQSLGGFWEKLGGSVTGAPVKGINVLGLGAKAAGFGSADMSSAINAAADSAPGALRPLAERFSAAPGKAEQVLGQTIQKVTDSEDPNKRRAILFAVMQNPAYRRLLGIDSKEANKENQ